MNYKPSLAHDSIFYLMLATGFNTTNKMEEIITTQEIENALLVEFNQYGNFETINDIFPEIMGHSETGTKCIIEAIKELCVSKHGQGYCLGYETAKGDIGTQDELPL